MPSSRAVDDTTLAEAPSTDGGRAAGSDPLDGDVPGDDALGDDVLGVVARLHRWATWHAELPVPPAQLRLLALLDELGEARIGELARADHCTQPTMSAQVQRLEVYGWLDRVADSSDARACLLTLSVAGHRVLGQGRQARTRAISPLLAALPPADREALARAVRILDGALVAAAPEPVLSRSDS